MPHHLLTAHNIKLAGGLLTGIVTAAGIFCASTPTPPKNSLWGKVYAAIEYLALNIGRAKQVSAEVEKVVETSGTTNIISIGK